MEERWASVAAVDFPQLIGPSYTSLSATAEVERSMNLYLERIESGAGRNPFAMYKSPGLEVFSTSASPTKMVCRGLLELNGHLFDVQDDTIYDIDELGAVAATYGPIALESQGVSMDASLNSLFVVSAGVLYRINSGVMVASATPFSPIAVGVLSGLVVAIQKDTNRFYFSDDDGQTWGSLDYQTAEAYPNALVNLVVDHQELWLFGNRRTQVFVLGDNPDAPFVAVSAGVIEMGLSAKLGVTRIDNSIFWLGRNRNGDNIVWRANGYTPLRVSNHAVENAIRSYGTYSDAIMQSYQLNGHSCVRITFPSANGGLGATWEYDISSNNWTEVGWWDAVAGRYERHRGNFYVSAFNKIIVGDYKSGYLYSMSPDNYTDFGYPLRWERRCPHVTKDGKKIKYGRFDLFIQYGVGLVNPYFLNDYSMDRVTFDAAVAALLAAATITVGQALAVTRNYVRLPYSLSVLSAVSLATLATVGCYPWGLTPEVAMRYSNDGGNNYTSYSYRSMGMASAFGQRVYWNRCGMGRDRVWEISGDAPVKTAIVQGTFEAEVCNF